eukprot:CAMPEP_0179490980 /NCGR_PEP_ID=MMETSP0799-20121207/65802_1 /TAXON_ID=46947 /ORGANISM="Geminigera cryophila, Strain CCMP2564" /LENGTH=47 /DNA_ID= /DNA_START= /DNA_END= /DNA_ORIENTATION=
MEGKGSKRAVREEAVCKFERVDMPALCCNAFYNFIRHVRTPTHIKGP